jgi:hypothetical protein
VPRPPPRGQARAALSHGARARAGARVTVSVRARVPVTRAAVAARACVNIDDGDALESVLPLPSESPVLSDPRAPCYTTLERGNSESGQVAGTGPGSPGPSAAGVTALSVHRTRAPSPSTCSDLQACRVSADHARPRRGRLQVDRESVTGLVRAAVTFPTIGGLGRAAAGPPARL